MHKQLEECEKEASSLAERKKYLEVMLFIILSRFYSHCDNRIFEPLLLLLMRLQYLWKNPNIHNIQIGLF
jgi:hypothetical protein